MTVLAYHDVVETAERDSSGFPGPLAGRYKLTPGHFEAHLEALAAAGRPVRLSFDDGGASSMAIADALERRGWSAHFFLISGRLGQPGFIGPEQAVELRDRGHVIGSHSHSHPTYMARLDREQLEREWAESRRILTQVLGRAPDTASVPGGFYSDRVAQAAARAGYSKLFTSTPTGRVRRVGTVEVIGRYAVWDSTPAATAAAYARRGSYARLRLELEWKAKTAAKSASPALYDRLRRLRAGG